MPEIREKSLASLTSSLRAGDALGAHAVVLHPGSALAGEVAPAIARAGEVIAEALAESEGCPLHLENTAGTGGTLGRSFGELAALLEAAGGGERLGLCLDSCHLLASGYDIRTAEGLDGVLDECVELVGLERLGSLHLNDSATPLGSNRDRHAERRRGRDRRRRLRGLPVRAALRGPAVRARDARTRATPARERRRSRWRAVCAGAGSAARRRA